MPNEKSHSPITRTPRTQHIPNSTDATRGEPLAQRALTRRAELSKVLDRLPIDELRLRADLEAALAAVTGMLTGDLDHLSDTTAADLNRWLENVKHLGETAPKSRGHAHR